MNAMQSYVEAATGRAKSAISLVNAEFAAADIPLNPADNPTAGAIAAFMAKNPRSPKANSRAIKQALMRRMAKAAEPLTEAAKPIGWLRDCASHIDDGKSLPSDCPQNLRQLATTVRLGSQAGTLDPTAVVAQLRKAAGDAEKELRHARDVFRQLTATASIAHKSQAGAYFLRCGPKYEAMGEGMKARAERARASYRRRWPKSKGRR